MHDREDFSRLPIHAAVRLQVQKYLHVLKTLFGAGLLLLQPVLQVVDPAPALSELAVFLLQCIAAVEGLLLAVNEPPQPVNLSLNAEVPQGIEGVLNAWVKGVCEGLEGGKDEAGGCWCVEGESIEGLRVVAHYADKYFGSVSEAERGKNYREP